MNGHGEIKQSRELFDETIDQARDFMESATRFNEFVRSLPLDEGIAIVQGLETEIESPDQPSNPQLIRVRNTVQDALIKIHGWSEYTKCFVQADSKYS